MSTAACTRLKSLSHRGSRCVAAALVRFRGDGPLGAEARRLGDRSVEEIFELWEPVDAVEGLGNLQGTDEQIDDGWDVERQTPHDTC